MKVYDKRLASPYLAWMVLFTVIPLLIVCYYALTDGEGQFTLANLASVSGYGSVFARSLLLALIATVICLVIAFPVGYFFVPAAGEQAADHADAGDAAHVDEFSATHLCLDGPAEHQRPHQYPAGTGGSGPVQYAQHGRGGGAGHGVQLCALYDPASIHQHDQDRPEHHRGRPGPGRQHHQDPVFGC